MLWRTPHMKSVCPPSIVNPSRLLAQLCALHPSFSLLSKEEARKVALRLQE